MSGMTPLCDDPTCHCCHPENEHRCECPLQGSGNVGDTWTCPECGMEYRALTKPDWENLVGCKYPNSVEPLWLGLTKWDTEAMKSHGFTITADADEYERTVSDYRAECDCGWESQCCDSRKAAIELHNEHLAFVVDGPKSVKED